MVKIKLELKEELDRRTALKNALELVDSKTIVSLFRNPSMNDEPKFFRFTASVKYNFSHHIETVFTGGVSLYKDKAIMKAIGEAIERHCLSIYKDSQFVEMSYNDLLGIAIDPSEIVSFSEKQLKREEFKAFHFTGDSVFKWTEGFSLTKKKKVLIPAQLIYVPYTYNKETVIRFPITTGAASGSSMAGAIYRGMLEVVEREAFMIAYLNKLKVPKVNIEKIENELLKEIVSKLKRYNLHPFVFDITTDLNIPSFMAIVVDKTGIGPALTIGLKSDLDHENAIIGALEEAIYTRPWLRELVAKHPNLAKMKITQHKIFELKERGLFWYRPKMLAHLNFWLKSNRRADLKKYKKMLPKSASQKVMTLLEIFRRADIEVFMSDVTTRNIKSRGFFVCKILIPKLHPLYLYEPYKYLGGERLYQIPVKMGYYKKPLDEEKLNQIPHPFL